VKDIVGVVVFLMVFSIIVFFAPEGGGYFLEYNNFLPADPLKTPPHIARSGTSRLTTRCCGPWSGRCSASTPSSGVSWRWVAAS
jgi:hypothetical protein